MDTTLKANEVIAEFIGSRKEIPVNSTTPRFALWGKTYLNYQLDFDKDWNWQIQAFNLWHQRMVRLTTTMDKTALKKDFRADMQMYRTEYLKMVTHNKILDACHWLRKSIEYILEIEDKFTSKAA